MPQPRERIILKEPVRNDNTSGAAPIERYNDHPVFANRFDRGGRAFFDEEIAQVEWRTRFEINKHGYELIDQYWLVEDRYQRTYTVVAVADSQKYPRRLLIYTERKQ